MEDLAQLLQARFGAEFALPETGPLPALWSQMAGRASCRSFRPEPLAADLLRLLSGLALSMPTKSDLQQRDLILITDPALLAKIKALVPGQPWLADVPAMVIVCGNNARQRLLHQIRGRDFANDHLDAFFNAATDAALALAGLTLAAEAIGLGSCAISALRNEAAALDALLGLPDHVFVYAGLALGWPAEPADPAPRLGPGAVVHENRYGGDQAAEITAYDARRNASHPYARERGAPAAPAASGRGAEDGAYGWSEDKARQYGRPERADYGRYIRAKGFCLD